jgi:HSP20 family protein
MDPFTALRSAVNRALDEFPNVPEIPWMGRGQIFPPLNIWADEENLYVEAELPGIKPGDIETYAVGKELTIKGRRPALPESNLAYHRQERGNGEFTRILSLPMEVETEKVQAALKNGILSVTLPRAKTAKARKIEVKAG